VLLSELGLLILVVAGLAGGVARRPAGPAPAETTGAASGATPDLGPGSISGSIYDLGLTVLASDGARHPLGDLRGHPVLATMFYASCPTVCPMLIADLRRAVAALPPSARADARVLLVSFDPARDTAAVLRDVLARHGLDAQRWRVAVAPDEDGARTLAAALGIRYRAAAGGSFDHTARIVLLDRDGKVRAATDDPADAATTLAPLVAAPP
jgi:protein SCO1/2